MNAQHNGSQRRADGEMDDEDDGETVSSFYSLFAESQQQPQPPQAEAMDESGG